MPLKQNRPGVTVLPSVTQRDEEVRKAGLIRPQIHREPEEEPPMMHAPRSVPYRPSFRRRPSDDTPSTPVVFPNDLPGPRPGTLEEIEAHNARQVQVNREQENQKWATITGLTSERVENAIRPRKSSSSRGRKATST